MKFQPPECLDCGACCRAFGIIEVKDTDSQVPIGMTQETELGYRRMKTRGFWCAQLLPNNRCAIYNCRPSACILFRRGSSLCKMAIQQMERIQNDNSTSRTP